MLKTPENPKDVLFSTLLSILLSILLLLFLSVPTIEAREDVEILAAIIGFSATGPEMMVQGEQLSREIYSILSTLSYYNPLTREEMERQLVRAGLSREEILENPTREYSLDVDLVVLGEIRDRRVDYYLYTPKTNTWQSGHIPWEGVRKASSYFQRRFKELLPNETLENRVGSLLHLPSHHSLLLVPGQRLLVTRSYHQIYTNRIAKAFPDEEIIIGEVRIRDIGEDSIRATILEEEYPIEAGDRVGFPLNARGLGGLTLLSHPTESSLFLNRTYLGETPLTLKRIPAGTYRLSFERDGYERKEETFVVKEGEISEQAITLSPLPSRITITSNRKASLFIGGVEVGRTPWKGEIPPGFHTIEVKAPGYPRVERSFRAQSNRDYSFYLPIYGEPGSLYITTDPAGAQISLEGRSKGVTPFTMQDIEPGYYRLEINKKGYREIKEEILIYSGDKTQLHLFLEEAPGLFTFSTTPEGATIYWQNRRLGNSPLTVELPRGIHEIVLEKEGFKTERLMVESLPEKREEIHTPLTQLYGNLEILSHPSEAEVYLGEKFLGLTPLHLKEHPAGRFTFTLKREGKMVTRREVFIPPYETETLFVELRREPLFGGYLLASYDTGMGLMGLELGVTGGKRHGIELSLTHLLAPREGGYGFSFTELWGTYQYSFWEEVGFFVGSQYIVNPVKSTALCCGLSINLLDGRIEGRLGPYLRQDTTGILWEVTLRGWMESLVHPLFKIGGRPERSLFFSFGASF